MISSVESLIQLQLTPPKHGSYFLPKQVDSSKLLLWLNHRWQHQSKEDVYAVKTSTAEVLLKKFGQDEPL